MVNGWLVGASKMPTGNANGLLAPPPRLRAPWSTRAPPPAATPGSPLLPRAQCRAAWTCMRYGRASSGDVWGRPRTRRVGECWGARRSGGRRRLFWDGGTRRCLWSPWPSRSREAKASRVGLSWLPAMISTGTCKPRTTRARLSSSKATASGGGTARSYTYPAQIRTIAAVRCRAPPAGVSASARQRPGFCLQSNRGAGWQGPERSRHHITAARQNPFTAASPERQTPAHA